MLFSLGGDYNKKDQVTSRKGINSSWDSDNSWFSFTIFRLPMNRNVLITYDDSCGVILLQQFYFLYTSTLFTTEISIELCNLNHWRIQHGNILSRLIFNTSRFQNHVRNLNIWIQVLTLKKVIIELRNLKDIELSYDEENIIIKIKHMVNYNVFRNLIIYTQMRKPQPLTSLLSVTG